MTFGEITDKYLSLSSANAKKLSEVSGISASTLSRLRNSSTTVSPSAKQLEAISLGLSRLSGDKVTAEEIKAALQSASNYKDSELRIIPENLSELITVLDLNVSELAKSLNFDASYLSRIRNGQRKPADVAAFAEGVSRFAVRRCRDADSMAALQRLTNCGENAQLGVEKWLCEGTISRDNNIDKFLTSLDDFNLDEYIKSIHFDDIKVPTLPFNIPTSKTYYGINEMKRGELDFFKAAILSKSKDDIFMHSEMPMADMAEDIEFGKKWMMSIAMLLKKGVHMNIIHNLDRPWNEIMLGLEAWIPIYMTGLISPYYIKRTDKGVFRHLNYTSGTTALSGECVEGKHSEGRYYLTNNKAEVEHFKKQAESLLSKASPLMEIYTAENENDFYAFLETQSDYYEQENAKASFKNIKVTVCPERWAAVSKDSAPRIHFLIHHPRLVAGIERYEAAVNE